ncbi:MAG: alpha/beta hydrolase [Gammaproteobacteria bacterium]|nr:alpha/beta hydrolase [Gammaproteobacteria bacterium]
MKMSAFLFGLAVACTSALAHGQVKNVVLVHGAFADGSGWKAVTGILERGGYSVYVVQEPLTSFEADVAATRAVLDRSGPCVLVGHSWAGMIITELGAHPSVRSLVYVDAFEPQLGETAGGLQSKFPPAGGQSVVPYGAGFVYVKPEAFAADFAGGAPAGVAHFMSISQQPIATASFDARVSVAGWLQKPSYATVGTNDRQINPELLRFMAKRAGSTTIELPASHVIFLTHPKEVAALIEKAAKAAR